MPQSNKSTEQRFWDKVDKNGPVPPHMPHLGQCWIWTAGKRRGYGIFRDGKRNIPAHWFLLDHYPEKGFEGCHHCDNRACIRQNHVFIGTRSDNVRDEVNKGRNINKQKTHCPKGHPYSGSNLMITTGRSGRSRTCKICHLAHRIKNNNKHNNKPKYE